MDHFKLFEIQKILFSETLLGHELTDIRYHFFYIDVFNSFIVSRIDRRDSMGDVVDLKLVTGC